MNTLTTDGSFWNEYDFFDSDDLKQKSIGFDYFLKCIYNTYNRNLKH